MARKVLTGTLSLTPGTAQTAHIHLPATYSVAFGPGSVRPDPFLSRVIVSDPVNTLLFRLVDGDQIEGIPAFGIAGVESAEHTYYNIYTAYFLYTLTGVDPVDVEFTLVWPDSTDPTFTYVLDTVD